MSCDLRPSSTDVESYFREGGAGVAGGEGGVVLSMKEVSSSLTALVKDGVGSASLLTGSSEGGGGVAVAGSDVA